MRNNKISLRSLNLSLLALSAQISIPFFQIPFTLQVLMINILARINTKKDVLYTMVLYLALGLVGLPIFSNAQGGPMIILSPTFGFLIGFIFYSLFINKFHLKFNFIFLFLISSLILYSFGLFHFNLVFKYIYKSEMPSLFRLFGLIYLPSDFVSSILAISISKNLQFNLQKV